MVPARAAPCQPLVAAQVLKVIPAVAVKDAATFPAPTAATVIHPFELQHWPGLEMLLADPDGRELGVHAPLPQN